MAMDPYTIEREENILTLENELKRSSDMAVINHPYQLPISSDSPSIDSGSSTSSNSSRVSSPTLQCMTVQPRIRRFSASFSPNFSPLNSPGSYSNKSSRINQLKQEEGMDMLFREVAHERETQSALKISLSWEDLTLDDPSEDTSQRKSRLTDPLHLSISSLSNGLPVSNSPSPTRRGRQCFSPSMQTAVRTGFSPSPSPSPTRKTFTTRRSSSPIALRPSALGPVKRKCDLDGDKSNLLSPKKQKLSNLTVDNYGCISLHQPFHHGHSVASGHSHLNYTSPFSSLDSSGTPDSLTNSDSPNTFKLVEDSRLADSQDCSIQSNSCNMNDDSMFDGPVNLSSGPPISGPENAHLGDCCTDQKNDPVTMEITCSSNAHTESQSSVIAKNHYFQRDCPESSALTTPNLVNKTSLKRSNSVPSTPKSHMSNLSKHSPNNLKELPEAIEVKDMTPNDVKDAL